MIELMAFRVGTGVRVAGTAHLVTASVRCTEGTETWYEHQLTGPGGLWLAVDTVPEGARVSLWRRQRTPAPVPGGDAVRLGGQVLRCVERGHGRYRAAGSLDALEHRAAGVLQYAEFRAGDQHAAYEQFGAGGKVLRGIRLPLGDVEIAPGETERR